MNEPPLPIGLYSVVSVIDLKIKRHRKHWRTVKAMAWDPNDEDFKEFVRNFSEGTMEFLRKILEGRSK